MKPKIFSTFFVICIFGGYFLYWQFHIFPKDLQSYKKSLYEKNKQESVKNQEKTLQAQCFNLEKNLWQNTSESTLRTKIQASSGSLLLKKKQAQLIFKEYLHNVFGVNQESVHALPSPHQKLRVFFAKEGSFDFQNQEFVAPKLTLKILESPGTLFPTKLNYQECVFSAQAKDALFRFQNQKTMFHSSKLLAETVLDSNFQVPFK